MEQLTGFENVVLGTASGICQVFSTQPLLYWKNAAQQRLGFTINPRILYRGTLPSIINYSSLTAVEFYGTGKLRKIFSNQNDNNNNNNKRNNNKRNNNRKKIGNSNVDEDPLTVGQILLSTIAGGILGGIVCGPLELIMIQQQRFGNTMISTISNILFNYRFNRGICRGLMSGMMREMLFSMALLGFTPITEHSLYRYISQRKNNSADHLNHFVPISASLIVSLGYCGLSHPIDTIKTCMQGDIEQETYKTFRHTVNILYKNGGIERIYRGFIWRCSLTTCVLFVLLRCKNTLAPLMYPQYFENSENDNDK